MHVRPSKLFAVKQKRKHNNQKILVFGVCGVIGAEIKAYCWKTLEKARLDAHFYHLGLFIAYHSNFMFCRSYNKLILSKNHCLLFTESKRCLNGLKFQTFNIRSCPASSSTRSLVQSCANKE